MSDDTFTPAPLISDQPVGSFVEDSLTPPAPSAFESSFEWARYLGPVARSIGNASATYGDFGDWGERITEPQPPISKSEFDSKYSIPGRLDWDGPKPDSVYKSIYDTKLDELKREDAAERRPAGIVAGAADLGVSLIADALDPLFLGSLIIPGVPEIGLGEGLVARQGGRALTGLASGTAQLAPLIGLKLAVARQEQADYTAGSALADLAMGAGLGAALHVGMGAFGDLMDRRMAGSRYRRIIEADPDARRAVFRTAAAQVLNDDPLELDPVFDAVKTAPGGEAPYPADQPIQPYAPGPVPGYITDPVHPTQLTPGARPFVPVPPEPQRLVSYLIAAGGLKSDRGDILQVMGGWRGRPGLLSPKNGRTIEDATLNAWQDGFFPNHSERPEPKDLIAAIEEDLKGNPQYSHYNEASLRAYQDAWATNNEVVRLAAEVGLPTTNITREQLLDAIHDHLTPEDFDARVGTEGQRAAGLYEEAERQAQRWAGLHIRLEDQPPEARAGIQAMVDGYFDPEVARGKLVDDVEQAGGWEELIPDDVLREDIARFDQTGRSESEALAAVTPEQIAARRAMFQHQASEERAQAQKALDWFDENHDLLRHVHELQGQEPHGGFDAERFYGADRGRSLEDLENDYRSETAARDARELAAGDEPGGSAAGDQGGVSGGTQPGGSGAGAAGRESAADRAARFAAALRRAAGERPVDPADAAANTAADAATKLNATERLAQAQKQVDQDAEFFQRVLGNQEAAAQGGETTAVHRVFDTANDAWDVIHRAEIPDVTVAPNPEGGYWIVNRDGTPFATGVTTVQRSAVDQAFGDMVADEIRAELEALGDVDKDANAVGEGAAQAATCVIRGLAGGAT